MTFFYTMLMFTEALSAYVKPLIYQIKHTCVNKVQNSELKKNTKRHEESYVTKVGLL